MAADLGRTAWRLERHAGALADAAVPLLGGRAAGKATAESMLFHAQRDARAAAALLDAAGDGSNATTLREAAAALGTTPLRTGSLRQAGSALSRAIGAVPDRDALVSAYRLDPEYEAATMLIKRPDELTGAEWRRLHQLVLDDLGGDTIQLPASSGGLKEFRNIADYRAAVGEGTVERVKPAYMGIDYNVQEHFDGWAVMQLPAAERQRVAIELSQRAVNELTRRDWATLSALTRDPLPGLPRQLDGLRSFSWIAWGRWSNMSSVDGAERYLEKWRLRQDPEHLVKLEVALDAIVDGSATAGQRQMAASEWDLLAERIMDRPPAHRSAIAGVMITSPGNTTLADVGSGLTRMRAALDALPESPTTAQVRAASYELIDHNLMRLRGVTPPGAARGYLSHPDYAELGRLRENMSLLQALATEDAKRVASHAAAGTFTW